MADTERVRRQVIQRLESLERAGVAQVRKVPRAAKASPAPAPKPASTPVPLSPPPPAGARSTPRPTERPPAAAAAISPAGAAPAAASPSLPPEIGLEIIRLEVAGCVRCPQLAAARTKTVFGVGNIRPRLAFLGEAPGADEDAQGEPFVGRAGQLLTKIIEACRLKREEVYILNVLKCRPPENRPPEADEIANCRDYLERQLEILRPGFICCLGSTASKALLNTDVSIGKLRGRFHDYRGATVLCTYHPSYLLRNPAAKRDVWEDMKKLLLKMGVDLDR
jgi:DNA polymerase